MTDDRIDLVRAGYDAMADRYLVWSAGIEDDPRPSRSWCIGSRTGSTD